MSAPVLAVHKGLTTARRLPALGRQETISVMELAALVLLGVAAAALSAFVKLNLEIPGHNILRVVFPLALGLALVPRVGSATIMGVSGMAGASLFLLFGARNLGLGAATSLALTGILIDAALLRARSGRSIYLRLALAGLAANLAAFGIKAGSKLLTGGMLEGLPLEIWLPKAVVTYSACGLLAGLVSAAVWFRAAAGTTDENEISR
ncbi:MAG: hypothetical protein HUU20_21095 [Pirellulales bacterium]|nr:hypothetical protein [Pirellulales bacterium]